MKKAISSCLALGVYFFSQYSNAVVYANMEYSKSNTDSRYASVVNLGALGGCTGIVVGLNPPTIVTARHCVQYGMTSVFFSLSYLDPVKIITSDFAGKRFDSQNPGDLAVLIYDSKTKRQFIFGGINENNLFDVKPIQIEKFQEVKICGFGDDYPTKLGLPERLGRQCGTNFMLTEETVPKLSPQIINDEIQKVGTTNFLKMPAELKVKVILFSIDNALDLFGSKVRFGVGALKVDQLDINNFSYDVGHINSLATHGDSGGPAFVEIEGTNHLLGVLSIGGYMGIGRPSDEVNFNIFWRTDHTWSQELFRRAVLEGADIRGIK